MSVFGLPLSTEFSWATPAAAVGGALLVAVLNIRQQRAQHLREKMLDAADAFQTSMQAASEALLRLARDSDSPTDAVEWLERTQRALEQANGELARLNLLFGPDSKTVLWAREALFRLDPTVRWYVPGFIEALERRPAGSEQNDDDDEIEAAREFLHHHRELADDHMRSFARSAFTAMRSPGRLRAVDRIREPLKVKVWWPIRHPRTTLKQRRRRRQEAQETNKDDSQSES